MSGSELRSKRMAAGISSAVLARKHGTSRSRLGDIERGYTIPAAEEMRRFEADVEELAGMKAVLQQNAAALGWPVSAPVLGLGMVL